MKKVELEKKVLDLEAVVSRQNEELVDRKIRMHKDGYIHIPWSWDGFWRGLACLGSFLFVWLNFYSVCFFWGYFRIGNCFLPSSQIDKSLVSFSQLFFCYPLVAFVFGVYLFVVLCKVWHDGGWDDIVGLVVGLVFGLVVGLVVGLVAGLVVGLVVGLVFGLDE